MTHSSDHPGNDAHERAALYLAGALSATETTEIEERLAAGDADLVSAIKDLTPAVHKLVDEVTPIEPNPAIRQRLIERAAHGGHEHPSTEPVWDGWDDDATDGLYTLPADAGSWEETGIDGIQVRRLFVDRKANRMTAMFRMAAGTAYVAHVHDGHEECFVLEGDLHVGEDIVMRAGDYQRASANSLHGRQWTEKGCVLLINSSLSDDQLYEGN